MAIEFGTDGARGIYEGPEVGFQVGLAVGEITQLKRFVMVQDTRTFNPELAEALIEGLGAGGVERVLDLGILPTPAAAITASGLTRHRHSAAWGAISLSASHNPAAYYGIKVFGFDGAKLDDHENKAIESLANSTRPYKAGPCALLFNGELPELYRQLYIEYLRSTRHPQLESDFLKGTEIIIDTANGAAHWSAVTALRSLGARVETINDNPQAEINKESGATDLRSLTQARQAGQIGFALDGDADRNISISASGRELDGDHSMHIAALATGLLGELGVRKVVSTRYSNLGLKQSLKQQGIFVDDEVLNGDTEVAKRMQKTGAQIGGERSGHTLFTGVAERTNRTMSGDGTVTAIQLLSATAIIGRTLDQLAIPVDLNLPRLEEKMTGIDPKKLHSPAFRRVLDWVKNLQGDEGDSLVRASGTEKGVVRFLVRDVSGPRAEMVMDLLKNAT